MSLHSNGSGQRYRSLLARRHVVLNLSTAFSNFDFKIQVVKFITNKSKGIANWPKQRWGIEDRATIQGHRWPASELFSVILLFPEGRNGQMAFTANGYIIRLLSPEIFLRLTFLTSIDWHLSIFCLTALLFLSFNGHWDTLSLCKYIKRSLNPLTSRSNL